MKEKLLDFFFPNPSMCVLCEAPADGLVVCADCRARFARYRENEGQCKRCGTFGTRAAACDVCRNWPSYYAGNTAFLPYTDTVREAILNIKFHDEPWRAAGFATILEGKNWPQVSAILPVPLHPRRQRMRGYNQSAQIARMLSKATGIPMIEGVLLRTVDTPHQIDLPRAQRLQNVQQAFSVDADKFAPFSGKCLLVVDDVLTTGATLLSCARALHKAGAKEIYSFTLAAGIH